MKIYSNDTITQTHLDEIDAKQAKQIAKLRLWLAASAAVNLLIAIGAYFF